MNKRLNQNSCCNYFVINHEIVVCGFLAILQAVKNLWLTKGNVIYKSCHKLEKKTNRHLLNRAELASCGE